MVDNLVKFPKEYKHPPILAKEEPTTHHEEIFEYDDGSYVILVLPNNRSFTVERMVFMAERLNRSIFDLAETQFDDDDVANIDDPK